jgi:vacuolar-type H+-ATPase subunit H
MSGQSSKEIEKLEKRAEKLLLKAKKAPSLVVPKMQIEFDELSDDITNHSKRIDHFIMEAEKNKIMWESHKDRIKKLAKNIEKDWSTITKKSKTSQPE